MSGGRLQATWRIAKTISIYTASSSICSPASEGLRFIISVDGRDILKRRISVKDELLGDHPVIQPTDFIILKLMAIANNPERISKDEGDILGVLKINEKGLIHEAFGKLDRDRIYLFAERFGQRERIESLLERISRDPSIPEENEL